MLIKFRETFLSLLSRGAWIEIHWFLTNAHNKSRRSSHEERGLKYLLLDVLFYQCYVAPLTRSVDWNQKVAISDDDAYVAPLTRSVDWNRSCRGIMTRLKSRSSHEERGLKYRLNRQDKYTVTVAPLTRSVDWNLKIINAIATLIIVAPLTRSVDWN